MKISFKLKNKRCLGKGDKADSMLTRRVAELVHVTKAGSEKGGAMELDEDKSEIKNCIQKYSTGKNMFIKEA